MTAPFRQDPTLPQVVSVYTLVRFGRRIVAKGELTADDAVEFRALMNRTSTLFELPFDAAVPSLNEEGTNARSARAEGGAS